MESICAICGKELGITKRLKIKDGYICHSCWNSAGFNPILDAGNSKLYSSSQIKELIENQSGKNVIQKILTKDVKMVNNTIFDNDKRLIKLPTTLAEFGSTIAYENIVKAEIIENGNVVSKSGAMQAIGGTILAGGAGAVIGGLLGRKTTDYCNSLKIKITVKNQKKCDYYITFLNKKVKKNSKEYSKAYEKCEETISYIDSAISMVNAQTNNSNVQIINTGSNESSADELIKFKKLLDDGAITKEEYELAKKKILK